MLKSVKLKNIKFYKDNEIKFESGLNILLANNCCGKEEFFNTFKVIKYISSQENFYMKDLSFLNVEIITCPTSYQNNDNLILNDDSEINHLIKFEKYPEGPKITHVYYLNNKINTVLKMTSNDMITLDNYYKDHLHIHNTIPDLEEIYRSLKYLNSCNYNGLKQSLLNELRIFTDNEYFDYVLTDEEDDVGFYFEDKNKNYKPSISYEVLNYLSLLLILICSRKRIIFIENIETNIHSDMYNRLCNLIESASEDNQIILSTYSNDLLDNFTKVPNIISLSKQYDEGINIEYYNKETLEDFMKICSIGKLWSRGDLGGNKY